MNERIKELAEQCHRTFSEHHIDLDRFAELIVRECMAQIEEVKQIKAGHAGLEYTQGFDDGMFVAIRTIEEHFGVEE
jgi:hypothetical protein